jgi:hypothetical protein
VSFINDINKRVGNFTLKLGTRPLIKKIDMCVSSQYLVKGFKNLEILSVSLANKLPLPSLSGNQKLFLLAYYATVSEIPHTT